MISALIALPVLAATPQEYLHTMEVRALRGVSAVRVIVEEPRGEARGAGLTRSSLKQFCELELRVHGIPVTEYAGATILYVNVDLLESGSSAGGSVSTAIGDWVTTTTGSSIIAKVWTRDTTVMGPIGTVYEAVRHGLREQLESFENEYLEAHQPPSAPGTTAE